MTSEKPKWKFPKHFLGAFRCTEVKYAEDFINKGTIKFNSPNSWVKYAKEKSEGRGDLLEGTVAAYSIYDTESVIALNNKYSDYELKGQLIREKVKDRIYLKLKSSMELPCFCFYTLNMDMFQCPKKMGDNIIECDMPPSFFRDFTDNMTLTQMNSLPVEKQPSIIIIEDYNEFEKRLRKKLYSLDIRDDEIISVNIRYVNYDHPVNYLNYQEGKFSWYCYDGIPPMELSIKDKRFFYQNEGRIIVNTKNQEAKNYLLNNIVDIGNMSDIAQKFDGYCYEGIHLKVKCDVQEYKDNNLSVK